MKSPCKSNCFFFCTKNFSETERINIFNDFWKISDEEKSKFYFKFVKRNIIKRRRVEYSNNKKFSYQFYLESNNKILRVCRKFFLNTLDITKRRIYYCFETLVNSKTGTPVPIKKGKNVKKVTDESKLKEIREHINSFETVDSHYCRSNTQKQYLESNLNLTKMYQLYIGKYNNPVKLAIYRKVFNNEYNIAFHKPKKDLCDKCFLFENKIDTTEKDKIIFEKHKNEKLACKIDRDIDRSNIDPNTCILCYDLQKVFGLPKGNASSFFYKRKLNVFNLTGTLIIPNQKNITYCSIWTEANSGRSGNDITSALIRILNQATKDFSFVRRIILWSDSCVPQNRNKINTTAIKMFMEANSSLEYIIQKFSEPGHSNIQEVDCVHSTIDRYLKNVEIYSPLHLIRLLKNIDYKNVKLSIMQMKVTDFKIYSTVSNKLDFSKVPFSKIKLILYEKDEKSSFSIKYKTSFQEMEYKTVSLNKKPTKKTLATPKNIFSVAVATAPSATVSKEKINDLKDLFPFLPSEDVNFYKALLKLH